VRRATTFREGWIRERLRRAGRWVPCWRTVPQSCLLTARINRDSRPCPGCCRYRASLRRYWLAVRWNRCKNDCRRRQMRVYRVAARRQNGNLGQRPRDMPNPGCGGPTSHLACHRELARILAMMRNLIGTKAFGGWFRCVNRMAFVTVLAAVWAESSRPASDLQTKQLPVLTTARQVHGLTVKQASLGYPVRLREWSHFGSIPGRPQSAFLSPTAQAAYSWRLASHPIFPPCRFAR